MSKQGARILLSFTPHFLPKVITRGRLGASIGGDGAVNRHGSKDIW
jgi:hypothetical protein